MPDLLKLALGETARLTTVGEKEPVSVLQTLELFSLDTVEGWSCETSRHGGLCQAGGEQVDVLGAGVESAEYRPLGGRDLGGTSPHARDLCQAAQLSPGVVAWETVVTAPLDVPELRN